MTTKTATKNGKKNRISDEPQVTRFTFQMNEELEAILYATIVGTAPLLYNRFGGRAIQIIVDSQTGKNPRKGKKAPKDIMKCLVETPHVFGKQPETQAQLNKAKYAIPAVAIKASMVRSSQNYGEKLVNSRTRFQVHHDGKAENGDCMIALTEHSPWRMDERPVRVQTTMDIRHRVVLDEWKANVRLFFDPEVTKPQELLQWLKGAGRYVGILEGRSGGRNSTGTFGAFKVIEAHADIPQRAD